jgi:hypothetical protein
MLYPKPTKRPSRRTSPQILADGFVPAGRVTMGGLRKWVLQRDGPCVFAGGPRHVCSGEPSLEHVPAVHGPSDVRRDDDAHTVALCLGTNLKPPSAVERAIMREYLRSLFPACPSTATIRPGSSDG